MTSVVDPVHLVPSRMRQFARRSLNRVGLDVSRHPFGFRLGQLLERHRITTVIDIGANEGQYARTLRANGYRGRLLSIEPLPAAFAVLRTAARADDRWDVRQAAVAGHDGFVTVNVAANSYSSSVLPMTDAHVRADPQSAYRGTETVAALTLDTLVDEHGLDPASTAVKVDVQGFESAVLDGATATSASVAVLQCELSLVELYSGQALMPQVVERLRQVGLVLWSLEPGFTDPRTGRLLQCDGVFVRDTHPDVVRDVGPDTGPCPVQDPARNVA